MRPTTTRIIIIGACAALFGAEMIAGCGSSSSATGTASGVAISGTVSVPTSTSSSESVLPSKSVGLKAEAYATDEAVGSGKTVTCTNAKTGAEIGTDTTDAAGQYSITVPTDATDIIVTTEVDGTTLSRLYTAAGAAAADANITADTTTAGLVVMQKCKDLAGENITVANYASKCGAHITAGTLIPDAIYKPFFDMLTTNLTGTPSATTGSGVTAGLANAFREFFSRKRGGDANLRNINPADALRGAYLDGDSTSLGYFTQYAPTTTAALGGDIGAMFTFGRASLGPSIAAVANDADTYAKFASDPAAMARLYDNMDFTNSAKIIADPGTMRFQVRDCFDNGKKDLLKDPKYFQIFTAAVGDSTFAAQTSDDARRAYMETIYGADLSGKTTGFDDIAKGFINILGAACPSGTCDSGMLQTMQNCPTCFAGTIVNDPTQFAGAAGGTVAGNLFNQFGDITSVAGAPTTIPTFKGCSTSSDCGSGFACFMNFCQPTTATAGSTTATKSAGEACSFSFECKTFMCAPVAAGSATMVCQENTMSGITLLTAGAACIDTSQCAAPLTCNTETRVCAAVDQRQGGGLGGRFAKASGAASTVLDATLFVSMSPGIPPTISIDLSGSIFGHLTNGVLADSKLSFSGTVTTATGSATLACSNIDVTVANQVVSALSGATACTLGGVTKGINHTFSTGL